jgi:predicted  nucleic acid-binding Zn-ribbon protein
MKQKTLQRKEKFSWKNFFLALVITGMSASVVVYFEEIQEKIFPQKHWQQKVEKLQSELSQDHWKVKNFSIQLEKEKSLQNFFIQEAAMQAENDKKNVEQEMALAKGSYQRKVDQLKQEIAFVEQEILDKERQLLEVQEKQHLAEVSKEKALFHR